MALPEHVPQSKISTCRALRSVLPIQDGEEPFKITGREKSAFRFNTKSAMPRPGIEPGTFRSSV